MVEISATYMYILWAAAIVIFAIVEAMTAQLVSIWFVVGAIAAFIAALLNANALVQVIIFIAVTVLALVITRPLVKKYIHPKKEHTNADRVIGQTAVTIEEIDNINATGQVKIDGKIWSARSTDNTVIPVDTKVIVDKISGVKLYVSGITK
ncbi:MAG: NfeD family protein [Eubacterium sp.]